MSSILLSSTVAILQQGDGFTTSVLKNRGCWAHFQLCFHHVSPLWALGPGSMAEAQVIWADINLLVHEEEVHWAHQKYCSSPCTSILFLMPTLWILYKNTTICSYPGWRSNSAQGLICWAKMSIISLFQLPFWNKKEFNPPKSQQISQAPSHLSLERLKWV